MRKPRRDSSAGTSSTVCCAAAEALRVVAADCLVCLEQGHECHAEGILHARSPEGVELAPEDAQGIADGLVAVPAEPNVEQVQAERAPMVRDIEVDNVRGALGRPRPRAARARSRCGSTRIRLWRSVSGRVMWCWTSRSSRLDFPRRVLATARASTRPSRESDGMSSQQRPAGALRRGPWRTEGQGARIQVAGDQHPIAALGQAASVAALLLPEQAPRVGQHAVEQGLDASGEVVEGPRRGGPHQHVQADRKHALVAPLQLRTQPFGILERNVLLRVGDALAPQ